MNHQPRIVLPKVIAGTSQFGNLYKELTFEQQKAIVSAYIEANGFPVVFDSAGKYGAGLALEVLGKCLRALNVKPDQVIISNKLAWMRVPLTTPEPTFEPGVWKNLQYDAVQNISYQGMLDCFEQGNALLETYTPQLISVHDPDEYLAAHPDEDAQRYTDILEAYRALQDLKAKGLAQQIGVGAKDWRTIERIYNDVQLDWVMLANSLTIYHHPPELLAFVERMRKDNVTIINSAVFHGGFLIGGDYFNYRPVSPNNEADKQLLEWRDKFFAICQAFEIKPAVACVAFATHIPGISTVALNSTSPERTKQNVQIGNTNVPHEFWRSMKSEGLIKTDYPFV